MAFCYALGAAVISLGVACGPTADTPAVPETPRETPEQAKQRILCEPPDALTTKIIETYQTQPERIRAAAKNRDFIQGAHLLQAIGDYTGREQALREIFRIYGTDCHGFAPTQEEYLARAGAAGSEEAFRIYGKLGSREGQLGVAQKLEQTGSFLSLEEAVKIYRELDAADEIQRVATTIFVRESLTKDAEHYARRLGVEPTPEMYMTRGDYWMYDVDWDTAFRIDEVVFEAYSTAGAKGKMAEVLVKAKEKRHFYLALDAAFYLDDAKSAREVAERAFVEGWDIDQKRMDRAGAVVDAAWYQKRGEYHLANKLYPSAFDAFTQAGDNEGTRRTLEQLTAPAASQ